MMYSVFSHLLYSSLFVIYIFWPVIVTAENVETYNSLSKDKIISADVDAFIEEDGDNLDVDSLVVEKPFFSFMDTPQEVISFGVESFAKSVDEFFSNDKVFYETSGTYLRLNVDTIVNETGKREYQGDLKLKLKLPHTKTKLKLTIESDPNSKPDETTSEGENTPVAAIEEKSYFTGIQATLGEKNAWQFKPSLGIRLGSTLEPYVRFRFKRKYEFNQWSLYWHETPYWFDSFGWGFDSYLELNKKITNKDLFRVSTFARWRNESDQFELSQTFSMYHTLSKRRAISYFAGVYGVSEPTVFSTRYVLGLTYRQNIHKDYLFVEILPQIRYEKTNDFHAEHSIIFRIEIVFKK